jgi:hypothetical protein
MGARMMRGNLPCFLALTFIRDRIEWLAMSTSIPTQLLAEIKSLTGLGETALAARLGVSQPTVNRILNGQMECKAKTLIALQSWRAELDKAAG